MIVKEKNGEGFLDLRICDNLELMAEIKDNTIDLIYCDILYGTGRKFADYQDLKPIRSEIETHYIPRIKEMHRILKPTGSIYLQMDTKINHWVRCIMDDIFGYGNFKNQIIWHYQAGTKSKKRFRQKHDIILFYSKTDDNKFNRISKPVFNSKRYKFIDEYGRRYDVNGQGNKYYLDDGQTCDDVWSCIQEKKFQQLNSQSKERIGYPTQKPKSLIERIIKASSNEGDLVADFYLGSGTTAKVCQELNRKFIGCDLNPKAIEITKSRLNGGQ